MIPAEQKWPAEFVEKYRAKGYWRGETFGQILRDRAQQYGDKVAVIDEYGQQLTYAQLDEQADALARGFLEMGLKKGDRVVVHMPNKAQFFPVIFALFRAGMLPVYALAAHRITEVEHFAKTAQACAYVIADQVDQFDYRQLAAELQQKVPEVQKVIVVGDAGPEFTSYDQVMALGRASKLQPQEPHPQEVAFLQISGGSTGLSKLIPRTHDDYIYTLRESNRICNVTQDSVFLVVIPVSHNYSMSSPGSLGALYAGAKVVLAASPSPERAFALIEREKVTITALVPPLLLVWLQAAPHNQYDISSLEVVLVGGAKLTAEVAKRVRPVLNTQLQQVFGMAEGLVNYTRLDDPDEVVIHTQGRPISSDDEILLLDDQGNPVPQGEPGYLYTRGPYTIRAYHNNPSANARSFTDDGYYITGDVAVMTPEGNLEVRGRANDHINRAGEKISAEEIEDHLLAHPQVFDAAVVSIPDEYLGERSCAFIIPNGEKPRAVEIKQWIRSRGLADFKVPDQVVFVEHFIETAVGKTSRKELRAALREQLQAQEQSAAKV
ncbi:2,3-dihydroxybenzoate-AMP ligase [Saezia sanguinis]|uniref:2,3-dihydroxybenzoate-AMP ligase n=1 Tax=Saezia sanguinis TaxID=1965230 RepID=A0A433SGI9_9BURK|nr:AMP-binding protein [Saezia sanguinis]RUS67867.1 2,3-dihydroxybenzoate-AMP ligase [Saezia sanguinis]